MPRFLSAVTGRALARSPAGATQTFMTPSRGASQLKYLPSGLILAPALSGLPNSTLRGMSGADAVSWANADEVISPKPPNSREQSQRAMLKPPEKGERCCSISYAQFVAFRSAKGGAFAERKPTIRQSETLLHFQWPRLMTSRSRWCGSSGEVGLTGRGAVVFGFGSAGSF